MDSDDELQSSSDSDPSWNPKDDVSRPPFLYVFKSQKVVIFEMF